MASAPLTGPGLAGAGRPRVGGLWVYAVVRGRRARAGLGVGLAGERLRAVEVAGLHVVVGPVRRHPRPSVAALRRHDRIVRRLVSTWNAVLPVRFGTVLSGPHDLVAAVALHGPALRRALALVRGCEQVTLRVGLSPGVPAPRPAGDGVHGPGPGARYLAGRLRAREVPELAPLRRALGPLVRAERVERHAGPPWLASVYHLVPHGRRPRYLAAVDEVASRLPWLRIRASGPWPAWAFAPEAMT
ncbi:MAG TPA: GvpL/GvpF family gas vesicle protein [Calidithermus sp.]|nr:GvpL/GvpF family gas vesicle protein [Calidithermus sp.]